MNESKEKVKAALGIIKATADIIRQLGGIPSGHLYARLMEYLSLEEYQRIIDILKGAKLVSESNHYLTWIGGE